MTIAAMEDISFPQKAISDPLPHIPTVSETFGLHHFPPEPLCIADIGRKPDTDKDGLSRRIFSSVMTTESQIIPKSLSQNAGSLGADSTFLNTTATNGDNNLSKPSPSRKKAKVADPSNWKKNKQKQLRMEGKAYTSKRKKDGEIVTKQPRAVGPRCTSSLCKKACNRLCNEIEEGVRKRLFDEFWQCMSWAQRRLYVAGQVDCDPVERSRAVGSQSRRSLSFRYHLLVDGKRKQVCKNMFLSTLGIGEWSVLNWAQKGKTENNRLSEHKGDGTEAVPQCPQQNPASSSVCYSVEVTLESENPTEIDQNSPTELESPARKKPRVARPLTWKQNQQKQLRMEGKPYISKRKKDGTTVTKSQRTMGMRCTSSACRRASNRFCADFSEEARNHLFTTFWQCMNWAQRKIYVAGLVDCDPVERTRALSAKSRRSVSMRYHLIANGDRKQVCKKMFLSTLGIGEWSVLNWAQNSCEQDENSKKQTQRASRKASEHIFLKEFLERLPKAPSYCCETSVSKLYLEPAFSTMSEVYRHYYNHCMEKETSPLSRQVFCAVFKKMDLGLCDHKKEQESTFGATGNLFSELWEEYCMERGAPGPQLEQQTGFKDKEALC
ncbi:uncharacterized protein LOC121513614 isoform X2 [Cheilinus undulatus]|uniref:uncharacterized protein LOC121513614 isoform X2 n=1 Tax=Cheilinus undulatus TaxID=241271 RepID=UPI001BD40038|nr:uncharacterized protein LOC121513614 isoform X2 [Cheilinus undulatus]